MKLSGNKVLYKYLFIVVAVLIAIGSVVVSSLLVDDLAKEERNKISIWAEATKEVASSENSQNNMNLIIRILESNTTIPVILHDSKEDCFTSVNIDLPDVGEQDFLRRKAENFKQKNEPIVIESEDFEQYVYYDDSYTLKQLQAYPYIQMGVLFVFVLTSILAFLSSKRLEQDRLWVGLTKETAHQLGTPISSLMAWIEYLRMKHTDPSTLESMEKDIIRLQMITDRFSKVGSAPALESTDVGQLIVSTVDYLNSRISKKVNFVFQIPDEPIYAKVSTTLFEWVVENLTKNAVDAMSGQGQITYTLTNDAYRVYIDISDTGKGLHKSKFKEIFSPGYTTKSRGWGLGLSLAKRIIEQYHEGRIYVKSSEINVGTTFRIELRNC